MLEFRTKVDGPDHEGHVNPHVLSGRTNVPVCVAKPQSLQQSPYHGDSDDDELSDDPVWMTAPRGSLQPAFPSSLMKKTSIASVTDTQGSSPVSPRTESAPSSGEVDELEQPRKSDSEDDEETEDHFTSEILTRPSLTIKALTTKTAPLVASEDSRNDTCSSDTDTRESMLRYRPSDVNVQRMNAMMSRDSLALEHTLSHLSSNVFDSTRGSPSPFHSYPASGRHSVLHSGLRVTEEGLSPFLCAAKTGNLDVLRSYLEDRTTSFTERDAVHGQSALHLAVRFGQLQAVKLLCGKRTRGLLIDAVDNRQNTPLHLAAAKSRRITKFLLEHGADTSRANNRNQTPLAVHLLTTKRDDPLITEMLLQHKTDPNSALGSSTLLHKAVELQCFEIGYRLVRHGARLDAKDSHGYMVFEKVDGKVLRHFLDKIAFPPVWVPDFERKSCMSCLRDFSRLRVGVRRHHCRHCGRLVCGRCSHVSVDSELFPSTFVGHLDRTASEERSKLKRVCKMCSHVFDERAKQVEASSSDTTGLWVDTFLNRGGGGAWDEAEGKKSSCVG